MGVVQSMDTTYRHIDHCVEGETGVSTGERETHFSEHVTGGAFACTRKVRYVLAGICLIGASRAVLHDRLAHL